MSTQITEKEFPEQKKHKIPGAFITRRIHSLLGLWLCLYLFEHLLVNSQAAFYFWDEGEGFISMVNKIYNLPYLKLIEITLLAIPFIIHGLWGFSYVRGAKLNSFRNDGTEPSLPQYRKNRAFSWQRITAWVLAFGIVAHVAQMHFGAHPHEVKEGEKKSYFVVQMKRDALDEMRIPLGLTFHSREGLKKNQILVEAPTPGVAFLLVVRQLFTDPMMVILYSIFVITACFHAYNGLWTAMIKWGFLTSYHVQKKVRKMTLTVMILVTALGLTAAWGSFLL